MSEIRANTNQGPALVKGGAIVYALLLIATLSFAMHSQSTLVGGKRVEFTVGEATPIELPGRRAQVHESNDPSSQAFVEPGATLLAQAQANATPIPAGEQPKIVFDKTVQDFGKRISGEELEATFSFRNEGKSTLLIERVKPG